RRPGRAAGARVAADRDLRRRVQSALPRRGVRSAHHPGESPRDAGRRRAGRGLGRLPERARPARHGPALDDGARRGSRPQRAAGSLHRDPFLRARRPARVRSSRRPRLPRPHALDGDADLPAGVPPLLGQARAVATRRQTADVVVIGGGLAGCALARELAQRGMRAVLVERGEPEAEARRAAAGMVAPQAETEHPGPLLRLGIESRRRYLDWVARVQREAGLDVEYRTDGILYLALDRRDARLLAARARWQRRLGLRALEIGTREAPPLPGPLPPPRNPPARHLPRHPPADHQ